MKRLLQILLLSGLVMMTDTLLAQSSKKGFDYSAHKRLNRQAGRWGKHRVKAADHDLTNLQCSVRKSRRHARRNKE